MLLYYVYVTLDAILKPVAFIIIRQVTAPGGRDHDRKNDLLVIRDKGTSFKIVHAVILFVDPDVFHPRTVPRKHLKIFTLAN